MVTIVEPLILACAPLALALLYLAPQLMTASNVGAVRFVGVKPAVSSHGESIVPCFEHPPVSADAGPSAACR